MKDSNNYDSKTVTAINDNNDKPSFGTNKNNVLNQATKPMALYGSFSFQDRIINNDFIYLNSANNSDLNDADIVDCDDHDRDDVVDCNENDEDYSSDLQFNKIKHDIGSRVDILLQNKQKILAHTDDLEEFLSDDDNDHDDDNNDENVFNPKNSNDVTNLAHDDQGCDSSYAKDDDSNDNNIGMVNRLEINDPVDHVVFNEIYNNIVGNDNTVNYSTASMVRVNEIISEHKTIVDKLNTSQSIVNEKLMTKVQFPSIIDDQMNSQPSIVVGQHVTIETSPYVAEHQAIAIVQSSSITKKPTKTQTQPLVAQQQQTTLHSIPSLKQSMKSSSTTPTDKVNQPTSAPQLSSSASKSKRLLAFLHTTPASISSNTKMSLLSDSTNINISRDEKNSLNVNEVLQPQNNYDNNNNDDKSCNTDGIHNSDTVNIDENKDSDYIGNDYNHSRWEGRYNKN